MIKLTKNRNIGRKKKVLILIFLFSLIFMGINPVSPGNIQKTEKIGENLLISPLTAEVHSEISIIGDTALDDFCDGNGTDGSSWANAHVIKDYVIDAGASGSAIEISDVTLYLIIQNCTVTNSGSGGIDAGIKLQNCMNVRITGCNSSNNNLGFYLYESSNNSLLGNNVSNNDYGIRLSVCSNNFISGNNVSYNSWSGIYLEQSSNNTLSGNNVSKITNFGIILNTNCDNNTIWGNNASYNVYGIYIEESDNNFISENYASYNDYGIYLYYNCDNNTLSGNDASYNELNGIWLETDCYYNTISGNNVSYNHRGLYFEENIEDNTIWMNYISNNSHYQVEADISLNSWDNGTLGNYWGDFLERYPDATSSNGIWWDWEYEVNPGYNDTRPLVHPGFPEISSSANVDYMIGDEGNEISWTISDSTILDPTYWIYLDDVEIQTDSWGSGSIISHDVDGLSSGTYNYKLICNDGTAWGWNESQIVVNVAAIPKPVIITTSQTISTENITVEWSEVVGVDSYNVYVNGTLTNSTGTLEQNIWLNETGTYSITVTAINGAEESEHSDAITIIVLLDDSNSSVFWYLFTGGWLLVAGFIGIAFVKVKMKK